MTFFRHRKISRIQEEICFTTEEDVPVSFLLKASFCDDNDVRMTLDVRRQRHQRPYVQHPYDVKVKSSVRRQRHQRPIACDVNDVASPSARNCNVLEATKATKASRTENEDQIVLGKRMTF